VQPAQALLVAMQDTPENSTLYFVAKEIEMLNDLCKSMKLDPIKPEERRKQDILTLLPNCKVFHSLVIVVQTLGILQKAICS
jgi:hypothetical protein